MSVNSEKTIEAIAKAKLFLEKDYLQRIDQAQVFGLNGDHDAAENLRLVHIETLLYDREERISDKIKALLGAVESYGESIIFIINGKRDYVDFYMGIASEQAPQPVFSTFVRSLNSLLPGCQYKVLHNDAIRRLMNDVLPESESINISSVAAFPSEADEQNETLLKLDLLIDGMKHTPFSAILLAKSIGGEELSAMRQQLQCIYTQLSCFEKSTLTLSKSKTDSFGENISQAITDSIGYNASISQGHSISRGTSISKDQRDDPEEKKHRSLLQLAGTASSMLLAPPESNMLQSLFYGNSLTSVFSSAEQLLGTSNSENTLLHQSVQTHEDESEHTDRQSGYNAGRSINRQQGSSVSVGSSTGENLQMTRVDKLIADILSMLDKQINQFGKLMKEGAFLTGAYFISGDSETVISTANLYRALCTFGSMPTLHAPICEWHRAADVANIRRYLLCGRHPIFRFPMSAGFPEVQVAQLIGLSDIPRYFALPEKTVPGMVVSASASFSRDIISKANANINDKNRSVRIGCVYHMGKEDHQTAVHLNMDDLTKHLFVAGATGSGKSNFCYQLLDELDQRNIKMLVIEPAKGEYRRILGGRDSFKVYGVDPMTGPVLRINPFAYPDGTPTVQHIERLLDIFNTAWPMYSAMPAILKEAVELIYQEKGFSLLGSSRPEDAKFPTFADLLNALPRVINASSYSGEVKGNYTGALVTRVKSLTDGLYGIIFCSNEIGDENLFNANVIADISRIGSMETKALLMGVLTSRLIEYRMAEGLMNAPLRHVTILEEAHNLLRNCAPSSDGANIRAASVELLSSAIAEMRTFGEGFIIADQSPSVMDKSVIRNTQTKVFFMMPDREDCQIAANSLSLNESQQQELTKLRPGVATVFQNGWSDAVLCKIDYFDKTKAKPFVFVPESMSIDHEALISQAVAVFLKRRLSGKGSGLNMNTVNKLLSFDVSALNTNDELAAMEILRKWSENGTIQYDPREEFSLLRRMLPIDPILRNYTNVKNISQWTENVKADLKRFISLTDEELNALISWGLHQWTNDDPNIRRLYVQYLEYACAASGNNTE